jgi:glycosyltransferase involved in cell wall biosynthesis
VAVPRPRLLVAIGDNVGEWRDALTPSPDRPRLPLPYAFGAATMKAGFRLSAIDLGAKSSQSAGKPSETVPFDAIYPAGELLGAMRATDFALLWGRPGLAALLKQVFLPRPRWRVLYFSYVWEPRGSSSLRQRARFAIAQRAAYLARGVVVMTAEQAESARAALPYHVRVIQLQIGVDCDFYAQTGSLSDIAEADRARVDRVLQSPYVIMPGDELRLNTDALSVVERSRLNLVRVSQYAHKNGIAKFEKEIRRRNLADRVFIFQRISYPALRFLMKHALAYAGLVDATWQPAGWTVACESLASGLPVVLYDGLTARELARLGAGPNILRAVSMRNTKAFASALEAIAEGVQKSDLATEARTFANATLNLERTGAAFGESLAQVICAE